jgi:hypothetical protein
MVVRLQESTLLQHTFTCGSAPRRTQPVAPMPSRSSCAAFRRHAAGQGAAAMVRKHAPLLRGWGVARDCACLLPAMATLQGLPPREASMPRMHCAALAGRGARGRAGGAPGTPTAPDAPRAAACTLSVRREMDALFGPEPKLVALHGAPGPVAERCAFQAKLGELVGDTVRPWRGGGAQPVSVTRLSRAPSPRCQHRPRFGWWLSGAPPHPPPCRRCSRSGSGAVGASRAQPSAWAACARQCLCPEPQNRGASAPAVRSGK